MRRFRVGGRRVRADLFLDLVPELGRRLDRFHHDIELAEPAFPLPHGRLEARIERQQRLGVFALLGGKGAEHVFRGEGILVLFKHG